MRRDKLLRCSGRLAQAVEEEEEKDRDDGVDKGGDGEVHVEPRLRLCEQNAAREGDDALVRDEEAGGEGESSRRMFGIEARADGGSEIADDSFSDAIEAERNSRSAETVLRKTDSHA